MAPTWCAVDPGGCLVLSGLLISRPTASRRPMRRKGCPHRARWRGKVGGPDLEVAVPASRPPPGLSPAPSAPLTLWLPPAAAPIWLAVGLLALGAAAQVVGYSLGRVGPLLWGGGAGAGGGLAGQGCDPGRGATAGDGAGLAPDAGTWAAQTLTHGPESADGPRAPALCPWLAEFFTGRRSARYRALWKDPWQTGLQVRLLQT